MVQEELAELHDLRQEIHKSMERVDTLLGRAGRLADNETAKNQNAPFEECQCSWALDHRGQETAARLHERLARIENEDPLEAAILMVQIVGDEQYEIDDVDLYRFVGQHTWTDQAKAWAAFEWTANYLRRFQRMARPS